MLRKICNKDELIDMHKYVTRPVEVGTNTGCSMFTLDYHYPIWVDDFGLHKDPQCHMYKVYTLEDLRTLKAALELI